MLEPHVIATQCLASRASGQIALPIKCDIGVQMTYTAWSSPQFARIT